MTKLFDQGLIGKLKLKNRIIMTAIHTGYEPAREAAFLAARAKGGAAACTVVMGVSPEGTYNNMLCISQATKPDIEMIASAVHSNGGKLIVQLFHCGRNASKNTIQAASGIPIAPSSVPSPIYKAKPLVMNEKMISQVIISFGQAAVICREAGADAIEISCSAGYLLSQFLSPITNLRHDTYGDSFENRIRFPAMVIANVRKKVGPDYPIILRVSSSDMIGGYTVEDTVSFLKRVEKFLDGVNVTGGWHESRIPQISMHLPPGGFADYAQQIKSHIHLPVIACNRINTGDEARRIVEKDYGDFAGCARAFLCDSNYVEKIKYHQPHRVCIACNKGCIEPVLKMKQAACVLNPLASCEGKRSDQAAISAEDKKKILVIGGGPSGMQAAITHARQGHEVRLCEKEPALGGLMRSAYKAPHKSAIEKNIASMTYEMEREGVDIQLNTYADKNYILSYGPEFVILASGSVPFKPRIEGIDSPHVIFAEDLLNLPAQKIGQLLQGKIVIIGGGAVGLETALFLANQEFHDTESEHFKKCFINTEGLIQYPRLRITVIEMGDKIGSDLGSSRWATLKELSYYGIKVLSNSKISAICSTSVLLQYGSTYPADTVVVATGYRPENTLEEILKESQIPYSMIGDARAVGTIGSSIEQASI
jgi:NADH:flavin oxidoreductases, Old Yellow Enzyme family